jgi:hypothetical protein
LREWLRPGFLRIESKPLQHCVHSRSEGVTSLSLEALEIPIISLEELR